MLPPTRSRPMLGPRQQLCVLALNLLLLLLLAQAPQHSAAFDLGSAAGNAVGAVKSVFGGGDANKKGSASNGGGGGGGGAAPSGPLAFGPIVAKSTAALEYVFAPANSGGSSSGSNSGSGPPPAGSLLDANSSSLIQLPLGTNASVTVHRRGPFEVALFFQGGDLDSDSGSAGLGGTQPVPFLEEWVHTAQAPVALLEAFMPVVEGPGTQGTLADAVDELMGVSQGQPLLRVLCTGEGSGGGGLALLCGPWAALQYPTANADVITFGASWEGFNTQFTWSFVQLATLHYQWTFSSSNPAFANLTAQLQQQQQQQQQATDQQQQQQQQQQTPQAAAPTDNGNNGSGQQQQAQAGGAAAAALAGQLAAVLSSLVTVDSVKEAVQVPRLPDPLPPDYQRGAAPEEALGSLAPPSDPSLEPPPEPGGCPAMLCKTRDPVTDACLIFREGGMDSQLQGLPKVRLHAASGADAVVAWDESRLTGVVLWEGTESKIDWLQDAILFFSDDFRPGNLSAVIPGVKVHRGFLNQFDSLATNPGPAEDNITAVLLNLSGGRAPHRIVVAGHSLGGALSELTGVWMSTIWPNASVLVANSGAPRVGDADWELMFTAVVGRAYRYVNHIDQVPELPPFNSFKQVPHGLWLRNGLVLVQDRPPYSRDQTTWDDHDCAKLYTPEIMNATAVTVPGFIYNATAA